MKSGYQLYRSKTLEELWTQGFSSIGNVTPQTAAYCARYVVKKLSGDKADVAYRKVDLRTGEEVDVEPDFGHMSLKPGIGSGFVEKYYKEIYRGDHVVVEGRKVPPPRYYDQLVNELDNDTFTATEYDRYKRRLLYNDTDWNRLDVLEEVAEANIKQKKGEL